MNLLAEVKDLTGWDDKDIAAMTGLSRITVNRATHGHNSPRINMASMKVLRDAMADLAVELNKLVLKLDMMD
jgi:hypothetical protein